MTRAIRDNAARGRDDNLEHRLFVALVSVFVEGQAVGAREERLRFENPPVKPGAFTKRREEAANGAKPVDASIDKVARRARDVQILQLFTSGWRYDEIAKRFGISASKCSQRTTAAKKALLDAALDGHTLAKLSDMYGLCDEIVADYVRDEARKRRERLIEKYYGSPDRPQELLDLANKIEAVAEGFCDIEPPRTTRRERRKASILSGSIPSDPSA